MSLTIIDIAHHRNGATGENFHVVLFQRRGDPAVMLATLFEGKGRCAVLDAELLVKRSIAFNINSWHGDNFEPALRNAIDEWEQKRSETLRKRAECKTDAIIGCGADPV